jgi:hypothetical protein
MTAGGPDVVGGGGLATTPGGAVPVVGGGLTATPVPVAGGGGLLMTGDGTLVTVGSSLLTAWPSLPQPGAKATTSTTGRAKRARGRRLPWRRPAGGAVSAEEIGSKRDPRDQSTGGRPRPAAACGGGPRPPPLPAP